MTPVYIVLAMLVLAVLLKKHKQAVTTRGWRINYSPGMPDRPTPQGAGWTFDFPTVPGHHVHYVQWMDPPPLGRTITARFAVTGGGFVAQEFPDRPALVTLLIQRRGDTGAVDHEHYRWYSRATVALAAGEFTLSAPLDVSAWGDVFGGQDAGNFAAALREVESIGLVFGSMGGRGHGVYATQPSRFTLVEMTAQQ